MSVSFLFTYRYIGLLFLWSYGFFIMTVYGSMDYFVAFFLESLFVTLVVGLLAQVTRLPKWLEKLSYLFFFSLVLIQIQAMRSSGTYLTILALNNADAAPMLAIPFGMIWPFLINVALYVFTPKLHPLKSIKKWTLLLIGVSLVFLPMTLRDLSHKSKKPKTLAPVVSLACTLQTFFSDYSYALPNEEVDKLLTKLYKEKAYEEVQAHPLLKGLPKNPNVIVFFTEGMSARTMGYYGGQYSDLTPNLNKLAQQSIAVHGYYNHTMATYRGLRGQFLSSYQSIDGFYATKLASETDLHLKSRIRKKLKTPLISVVDILNDKGYDTAFISPHIEALDLNDVLKSLDFNKVYTQKDYQAAFPNPVLPENHLFDKALIDLLEHVVSQKRQKPFMVGLYNFGTHYGIDSPTLKYGDGSSIVLNRFHQWDAEVGRFMQFLAKSPLAKNTVVIFTADHASYAGPEFTDVFKNVPAGSFVDEIPLLIYWQGMTPNTLQAQGKNSLAFAPTLLHLLGIQDAPNYFLGCSLFQTTCPKEWRINANGTNFLLTPFNVEKSATELLQFEADKKTILDVYGIAESYQKQK